MLGDDRAIKLFGIGIGIGIGIGLGSAVLLDAFAVRTVLVPSLMHLLGRANWYLPTWLDRALPKVSIEGDDTEQPELEKVLVSV